MTRKELVNLAYDVVIRNSGFWSGYEVLMTNDELAMLIRSYELNAI